jgi:putative hydrolase of the HAD superfamily
MRYHFRMPSNPITAITFDAGNTLLYCDPSPAEIYAEALSRHGRAVTAGEVEPVFADAWAELQARTPPGIDRYNSQPGGEKQWWGAFLREVLARLEHEAGWRHLLDELYAAFSNPRVWQVYPETRATLAAIHGRGLEMAVISNWDRRLPEILDGLELSDWFRTITVSASENIEKPAAGIFHRTLERLGVGPEETVHVGDSPLEDYDGSRAVGMTPVLVDRTGIFAGNGYRRIASLDEVLALLD